MRLIVGIGASAGGLDAFTAFFNATPPASGLTFILVQHLAPDHRSLLVELLAKTTTMPVVEAEDGMTVRPDMVFVIPPGATMTIAEGRLKVVQTASARDRRRPIDRFFQSLAVDQGENAVGIVLSGLGSDGSHGLSMIKERGGLTLAQAEFDAEALPGMPRSAAATGDVDMVLDVAAMPARILAHREHLAEAADQDERTDAPAGDTRYLKTIVAALRARCGHDFSDYKEKTLLRRTQRRMQALQLDGPAAYVDWLASHPEELDLLFRDLLIGVTRFFRDPQAFQALATALQELVTARMNGEGELRIWVPGCATGQEAYSIAILLAELLAERRSRLKVQVFGSDIDDHAIAVARLGRYALPADGLSPERLSRWFRREGDTICVVPEIREMCLFSTHSVIKHPPFSRLDLISCRNLLIYMEAGMQDRVMRTFHYALRPGGVLFLGPSESIARATQLFRADDKKHRIFRRLEVRNAPLPDFADAVRKVDHAAASTPGALQSDRIDRSARRLMEKYYPPHIVLDRADRIQRFSGGDIGRYLEPSPGPPSFDLFDLLLKPLRPVARATLLAVRAGGGAVRQENVAIHVDGRDRLISLIAEPLADHEGAGDLIVLAFLDAGSSAMRPGSEGAPFDFRGGVEGELRATRAHLQATINELERANEELKSANEEYQSVNEELQTANEEFETAKEEMQSVNEEVQTINAELTGKNEQLMQLNSDVRNLLDSTEVATIFLDTELRVKNFTRGMTGLFHLRQADIGRPITEIVTLLDYPGLPGDVAAVNRTLSIVERQVTLRDATMTFIMRVRPYRTLDNIVDGVVITFVDITDRHASEQALRETEAYLRLLVDSVADAVYCVDRDGATTLCNAAFLSLLGFAGEQDVIGVDLHDVIRPRTAGGSTYPKAQSPILRTARTGESTHRDDEVFCRADGSEIPVEYWVRPIRRGGEVQGAVCTFVETSERRQAEEQQRLLLREMDHRIGNFFAIVGSMVTLSARSAATPRDMADTVSGRLGALAAAHKLVRPRQFGAERAAPIATFGELVGIIVRPYADRATAAGQRRASISGPDVPIGGDGVASLAMVLHELATNAGKYGAFAAAAGHVDIAWVVDDDMLRVSWREQGGPPIAGPPDLEGFGSLLARRSIGGQLGGDLAFDWQPEGLTVRFSAAMEKLAAPPEPRLPSFH